MLLKSLGPFMVLAHQGSSLKLPRQAYSNNTVDSVASTSGTGGSSSTTSTFASTTSTSSVSDGGVLEATSNTKDTSPSSAASIDSSDLLPSTNSSSSTAHTTATITAQASPRISAGAAIISISSNISSSANVTNSTTTAGTCCYISPNAVGINHWYTSSIGVTVQREITTWLQSNGTLIPANSTTIMLANVTSLYTNYSNSWSTYPGVSIDTISTGYETVVYPSSTYTIPQYTFVTHIPTSERLSGIPNTLLPSNAQLYASTNVIPGTVTSYPFQGLAFTSPTPYLFFSQIFLGTSQPCDPSSARANLPIATTSVIAMPMEPEYTSNFDFWEWMENHNMTGEGAGDRTFTFAIPDDFPAFLAGIPAVSSSIPFIGSCTLGPGFGEPSVHIPVNQLTETSHVTLTLAGPSQTTTQLQPPSPTTTPAAPSPTNNSPTPTPTASNADEPAEPDDPSPTFPNSPSQPTDDTDVPALPVTTTNGDASQPPTSPEQTGDDATPVQTTAVDVSNIISVIDQIPAATPATQVGSASSPSVGDVIATVIGAQPDGSSGGGADDASITSVDTPASTPAQITIGGGVATANSDGAFELGSQTLQPGSVVTEAGNTISLAPSGTAIVINGVTSPVVEPAAQVTISGSTLTADANGDFTIRGQTLEPGSAITADGSTISLADGGTALVVDGITTPIAAPAAEVTLPGSTIVANEDGAFVVGGQTLQPGSQITIAGSTLSIAPEGTALVVNGATTPIDIAAGATAASVTVGDRIVTASPDGSFEIGSQVLQPGSAIIVSDTTYSLASDGGAIVVNGITSTINSPAAGITRVAEIGAITFADETLPFTDVGSEVLIDGQTLAPGSTIIVDGQTLSLLNPSQVVAISGTATSTMELQPTITSGPVGVEVGIFTLDGQTYSFTDLGATLVIDGKTLTPGGNLVLDGQTLSLLNPSQLVVVSASRTSTGVLEPTTTLTGPGRTSAVAAPSTAGTRQSASLPGWCLVVGIVMVSYIMFL